MAMLLPIRGITHLIRKQAIKLNKALRLHLKLAKVQVQHAVRLINQAVGLVVQALAPSPKPSTPILHSPPSINAVPPPAAEVIIYRPEQAARKIAIEMDQNMQFVFKLPVIGDQMLHIAAAGTG